MKNRVESNKISRRTTIRAIAGVIFRPQIPQETHPALFSSHTPTAVSQGPIQKHDLIRREVSITEDSADYSTRIKTLRAMREGGNPHQAKKTAKLLIAELKRKIEDPKLASRQQKLVSASINALSEHGWADSETSRPGEVWAVNSPIIHQLDELARKHGTQEASALSTLFRGDALYVVRRHDEAIPLLRDATSQLQNPDQQLMALRTLAKSIAYLTDSGKIPSSDGIATLKAVENQILQLIEQGTFSNISVLTPVYESLARARGLLGQDNAWMWLEKAKTNYAIYEQTERSLSLRGIELVRTELEIVSAMGSRNDLQGLETKSCDAAKIYPRLEQRINELLKKTL